MRCEFITAKGTRCKRSGVCCDEKYCQQHLAMADAQAKLHKRRRLSLEYTTIPPQRVAPKPSISSRRSQTPRIPSNRTESRPPMTK